MPNHKVISEHEVRIYRLCSSQPERWFANADLAREACVAARTARKYTRRFTDMKLLREKRVFPRYLYQWTGRKTAYVGKLKAASRALESYDGGKSRNGK
jgi:hypothetical protein